VGENLAGNPAHLLQFLFDRPVLANGFAQPNKLLLREGVLILQFQFCNLRSRNLRGVPLQTLFD